MKSTIKKLEEHSSSTHSKWREEAQMRQENKSWLRYSQQIAMEMLDRMEFLNITQKVLAEKMGCSQQYVSKILKGRENLSLETISKIESALQMDLMTVCSEC